MNELYELDIYGKKSKKILNIVIKIKFLKITDGVERSPHLGSSKLKYI